MTIRRALFALLGLLVCLALLWIGLKVWSYAVAERRSQAVEAQLASGEVDFARIGPSNWERVYFFTPYSSAEGINEVLGFEWPDADKTRIADSDSVMLVVFVRSHRVVGWFEHSRGRGDIVNLANDDGYSREAAKFRVVRDREGRPVLVAL